MSVEEVELVRKAVSGDSNAFEKIYHDHRTKVLGSLINLTRNFEEAEDLTSETFIRVFKCLPTFRGDSKLSSWIYRIAINVFLMSVRTKKKHIDVPLSVVEEFTTKNDVLSYIQFLEVMKIVETLPEETQNLLSMRFIYGYTNTETSDLLGIRPTTTKSHLHRTRKKIKKNYSSRSVVCQQY